MEDKKFQEWYEWIKLLVAEYQDARSRTAVIDGFFEEKHKEVFTGHQVSQILALRYPEK